MWQQLQAVEWLQTYHGAVIAVASIVLALLTVALAWIGRQQVKLTRILQRAYVSADPGGIRTSMEGNLFALVTFGNVGHLPATQFSWIIEPVEVTNQQDWSPPDAVSSLRGSTVLPLGAHMTMGSARIPRDRINETESGANYLYVWGRASYRDGFRKKRVTRFCHRYKWAAREVAVSGEVRIGAEHARYHDHGNAAD
jgi:hypothetical protein